jgi:hypothetical protein
MKRVHSYVTGPRILDQFGYRGPLNRALASAIDRTSSAVRPSTTFVVPCLTAIKGEIDVRCGHELSEIPRRRPG